VTRAALNRRGVRPVAGVLARVARGVTIVPVRVFAHGADFTSIANEICAIDHVTSLNTVRNVLMVTNRTPASTSRRAIRHCRPNMSVTVEQTPDGGVAEMTGFAKVKNNGVTTNCVAFWARAEDHGKDAGQVSGTPEDGDSMFPVVE
jgi:hypothetical protein